MKDSAIQPEVHEMIEAKDFAALKATVGGMEIHDLAELLGELEGEDLAVVFRLLPQEQAATVFGDLEIAEQEQLLSLLSSEKVATILNEMPPDERTELLEELPGELAQRLLNSLRGEELKIARSLLAYPEGSVGRLMTPEYVAVRPDWTIEQVFAHIRKVAAAKETVNVIYVVDDRWKLLDEIHLQDVVLADPQSTVADLMDEQFTSLVAAEESSDAVDLFRKYDAIVLPVVDRRGTLAGIVTVDDVLELAEEEDTEDFQKISGVSALESGYFDTSFWMLVRKRLPWLVLLLAAEVLTVVALSGFEHLAIFAILAVFVPLINSPAGNAGSQMAGLIIRGLAVNEMELTDWKKVLAREAPLGLAMGAALGAIGYPVALIFGRPQAVAAAVALAITSAVTCANIFGVMFPFFFKRIGFDPAVSSGPFIASVMDVTAIIIYFSIAVGIISAVGGL